MARSASFGREYLSTSAPSMQMYFSVICRYAAARGHRAQIPSTFVPASANSCSTAGFPRPWPHLARPSSLSRTLSEPSLVSLASIGQILGNLTDVGQPVPAGGQTVPRPGMHRSCASPYARPGSRQMLGHAQQCLRRSTARFNRPARLVCVQSPGKRDGPQGAARLDWVFRLISALTCSSLRRHDGSTASCINVFTTGV